MPDISSPSPLQLPPSARRVPGAFLSYAPEADGRWQRKLIRGVELLTGARTLNVMYRHAQRRVLDGEDPWGAALNVLGIELDLRGAADALPAAGPVIVVSNHPFGLLDGLAASHLIARRRSDYRVLGNSILMQVPEIAPFVLPIEFRDTPETLRINATSRRGAGETLKQGGALLVFPAGAVSTSDGFRGPATDAPWTPFIAKLQRQSQAAVVPLFFPGQNSRLFQAVSQVSLTLRLALLMREARRRLHSPLPVVVGQRIEPAQLAKFGDRRALTAYLRTATYSLGAAHG